MSTSTPVDKGEPSPPRSASVKEGRDDYTEGRGLADNRGRPCLRNGEREPRMQLEVLGTDAILFLTRIFVLFFQRDANLQDVEGRSQIGSGFSRW